MFARLSKRAADQPAHFLKSAAKSHGRLRTANSISAVSIRHQSSSSSSRDNDNSNGPDIEPMSTSETPVNASFELHRVDLAHGSFFALHRPLLGIANDPVDDLANYFSALHPYLHPTPPFSQPSIVTPSATSWASLPPSLVDAEQTVDEFLSQIQNKQQQQEQQLQQQKSDHTMDTETPYNLASGSINPLEDHSISAAAMAESILDPLLDQRSVMYLTSVLRKRRIKMRKHKYKKLRKRTRALRKKLGK
ncbi:hypothetical protein BGX26_001075 [Mortierella sp. AD094]|nr:hypothetical protein BGX26_001075 [Mortierella sp. AD094]